MNKRNFWIQIFPVCLGGTVIVALGIALKQPFYKMLPMLNTLIITLLSANANRYSFLLGGLNSILYGVVYISERVYFSAISSMAFAFPLQMFSFFNWTRRKNASKETTLSRLSPRGLIVVLGCIALGYGLSYRWLLPFFSDAAFPWADILIFVLEITISVLVSLCFVESQYLNVINCTVYIVLWFMISSENLSNVNYLVIGCYNLMRVVQGSIVWTKKYRESRNALKT